MELIEALRTTGSVRSFSEQVVSEQTLAAILDDARFAPSGGNRQAWRVVVVRDGELRRALRDAYLDAWHDYVAHLLAGLIPFSPLATDHDRAAATLKYAEAVTHSRPDGFPESLDRVPAMLVVLANLELLAATDRDLSRYQLVGGASIYPFVWSILLAARARGLGGVMTTVATRNEEQVRELLKVPSSFAVASIVALGFPQSRPTRLKRSGVASFASVDTFDGRPFAEG